MKGDLISRSALLRAWTGPLMNEAARQRIRNQPAVDAVPVVHEYLTSTGIDKVYCEFGDCSLCGFWNPMPSNYCRGCGAKLDREPPGGS